MTEQTPGRAGFIARNMALAPNGGGPDWLASLEHLWDGMIPEGRDAEEAGAQAAIDASTYVNALEREALERDTAAAAPAAVSGAVTPGNQFLNLLAAGWEAAAKRNPGGDFAAAFVKCASELRQAVAGAAPAAPQPAPELAALRKQLDDFTRAVINVSDRPVLTVLARDLRKRNELEDV
jgi:hypothetical protein